MKRAQLVPDNFKKNTNMDNTQFNVAIPAETLQKLKGFDKHESYSSNARHIFKKVIASETHKNPPLLAFSQGRKNVAFTVPTEIFNELKANQKGSLSNYVATLLQTYLEQNPTK